MPALACCSCTRRDSAPRSGGRWPRCCPSDTTAGPSTSAATAGRAHLLPPSIGPAPPTTCWRCSTTSGATVRGSASATPSGGASLLLAEERQTRDVRRPLGLRARGVPERRPPARPIGTRATASPTGEARRRATFPVASGGVRQLRLQAADERVRPPGPRRLPRTWPRRRSRPRCSHGRHAPLACEPAVEAQVYRMGGRHSAWSHLAEVTGSRHDPGGRHRDPPARPSSPVRWPNASPPDASSRIPIWATSVPCRRPTAWPRRSSRRSMAPDCRTLTRTITT